MLGLGRTTLPAQAFIEDAKPNPTSLGLVGAGSANVFSPPLRLAGQSGISYISLDLAQPPLALGLPATGLQGIYHRNITLDTRLALGYCRDISLISETDYANLPRPREINNFPADLVGKSPVEYSGIYEDGWMSIHAYVILGAANPGDKITVRAQLPQLPSEQPATNHVELLVNGSRLLTKDLVAGLVILEAPLTNCAAQVKVELRFEHAETLPAPDNRPVTVLLESINITPAL